MPLNYLIPVDTNDPNQRTKHHRLPESLGGATSKKNISFVPRYKHRAWHILFDNLSAIEVIKLLRGYYEIFGIDVVKSDLQKTINEGWANTSREKIKNRQAWYDLFEGMTLQEIVDEVNGTWIDPNCLLRIGIERVPKIDFTFSKK